MLLLPASGCLGYISFNDTFDLNIVIRTAVITPGQGGEVGAQAEVSIGAGGAIVVQSGEAAAGAALASWHSVRTLEWPAVWEHVEVVLIAPHPAICVAFPSSLVCRPWGRV
jgi:hypothetical protein